MVSMSQHAFQDDGWREGRAHRPGEPSPSAARSLGRDGRALLEHTVRQDVIPRLVAMRWVERATPVDTAPAIGDGTIRKLVALCLEPNSQVVAAFVAELHRSGVAPASIYEDLLAPAARQLGVMWENDSCTFADVTIGVLRLQNAQRLLAAQPLDCAAPPLGAPRALLMPVPGEQHTFGLSIVLDYFVRAGWEARLGPASSREQALALVRRERTEMLGLSLRLRRAGGGCSGADRRDAPGVRQPGPDRHGGWPVLSGRSRPGRAHRRRRDRGRWPAGRASREFLAAPLGRTHVMRHRGPRG